MDRPFPEPHPLDPDDGVEARPDGDPDEARDDALEREFEAAREGRHRASTRAAIIFDRGFHEHLHNPRG